MNKKVVVSIVAVIAIIALLGVFLVACNADSYQKKLEKKGYSTTVTTGGDNDDYEWVVTGQKGALLNGDYVSVGKFKTTDKAKEAEADAKKNADNGIVSYEVKRIGKIVIVGTAQGVKDAQ